MTCGTMRADGKTPSVNESVLEKMSNSQNLVAAYDEIVKGIQDSKVDIPLEPLGIHVTEKEIDDLNILNATKKALERALEGLEIRPDRILVDALDKIDTNGIKYISVIVRFTICPLPG